MKAWWESLSRRERLLTSGGAALMLALLLYALAWQPFQASHRRLRQSVAEQRAELAAMRQMAGEIKRLGGASASAAVPVDGRSLLTLVDQTARTAGLGPTLKRVTPQGENRLGVQFDTVEFDQLVPWLGQLERDHRIVIVNLSVDRAAVGRVNARLTVQGGRP